MTSLADTIAATLAEQEAQRTAAALEERDWEYREVEEKRDA